MANTVVQTMVWENYAAASDDWDGKETRWKTKSGHTYIIESTVEEDVNEAVALIEDEPNNTCYEFVVDRFVADDDYESPFVRYQRSLDPECWDTLYLDSTVRKGASGDWYMKRGYIAGLFNLDRPEFAHLAGKECSWIDNLTKGKCVLKIEGDKREAV